MRTLMTRSGASIDPAVLRGYSYLLHSIRTRSLSELVEPRLWHDKDLYVPTVIVRAAVIAAIHQAQSRLGAPGVPSAGTSAIAPPWGATVAGGPEDR
jgi:hypothetical protein